MMEEQPYLRKVKYNALNQSSTSLRGLGAEDEPVIFKTDLCEKEREEFFRMRVTFMSDVNKFGHLNVPLPEPLVPERKIKTLPNDLEKYPQFGNLDGGIILNEDIVLNEDLFL